MKGALSRYRVELAAAFLTIVLVVVMALWISQSTSGLPPELREAAVIFGSDLVEKRVFQHEKELGRITAIGRGQLLAGSEIVTAIVGQTGALFVDENGGLIKSIYFSPEPSSSFGYAPGSRDRYGAIQILKAARVEGCQFLVRNSFRRAELIDQSGSTIWTYGEGYRGNSWLGDFVAGDIIGDDRIEYVAVDINEGSLVALDDQLRPLWSKDAVRASHVELVDTNRDGKLEIVHDARTRIVLRDNTGKIVSEGETGHYVGPFSTVRWPTNDDRQYVLHTSDSKIRLFDFDGSTVAEYPAPLSEHLLDCYGTVVRSYPSQKTYFAAIAEYESLKRSVLYIYDSARKLVYQEVLPYAGGCIATVPSNKTGRELVLVGGVGEVLEYAILDDADSNRTP